MPDIFEEVDEALRRERVARVWERHKGLILLAIVGVVIGAGVYSGMKSWTQTHAERTTDALLAAGKAPDPVAALESFAKETPSDIGALALFSAAARIKAPDLEKAEDLYRRIGDDSRLSKTSRDRARILEARTFAARTQTGEPVDPQTVEKASALITQLDALVAEKTNLWAPQAGLAAAILAGWSLNDAQRARSYLKPLTDGTSADVPPSLARLAAQMDHALALRAAPEDAETPPATPQQTPPAAGSPATTPEPAP